MVGKRRAPEDSPADKRETRSAKVPRTEGRKSARGTGRKGAARLKTGMSATAFKSRAQPLQVNISHTKPPADVESTDPGFVEAIELISSSFATGSFGWKGSKRITVSLPKLEGEEEEEKVHVMLTINATVIGSKDVKEEGEEGEKLGDKAGEKAEEKESEVVNEPAQEEPAAAAEEAEGTEQEAS